MQHEHKTVLNFGENTLFTIHREMKFKKKKRDWRTSDDQIIIAM